MAAPAMNKMSLPEFLTSNEDYAYLAEFLFADRCNRAAVEAHLRALIHDGLITLETNHTANEIHIYEEDWDGFSNQNANEAIAYTLPGRPRRKITAAQHQTEMRHRELKYPELPCLRLQGGFIKRLLKDGVEKRHVSILPIEYVNVLFAAESVGRDHAHRWGPRGSPGLEPVQEQRPAAAQANNEPPNLPEEDELVHDSESEEELEYGDIPWALQDIYGICKKIHDAWEKHQDDSLKSNAGHLATLNQLEKRIQNLEQTKKPETKQRTNGNKHVANFNPKVGETRPEKLQPQKNSQAPQTTTSKRVRFHNEDNRRHDEDSCTSHQWTPWKHNQKVDRHTPSPKLKK